VFFGFFNIRYFIIHELNMLKIFVPYFEYLNKLQKLTNIKLLLLSSKL